jgi:hypothetical protein
VPWETAWRVLTVSGSISYMTLRNVLTLPMLYDLLQGIAKLYALTLNVSTSYSTSESSTAITRTDYVSERTKGR